MAGRWTDLAVLTLARTAMGLQFQAIAALGPFYVLDFALDGTGLGALIGLYLLPGVLLAIPGGWLGQRYGDTRLVSVGLGLMAVGGLAGAVTGSVVVLFLGRLTAGAGAVLLNVLVTKMVADRFVGRDGPMAMGILVSSWPLGLALAMILLPPFAYAGLGLVAELLPAIVSAACLGLLLTLDRTLAADGGIPARPLPLNAREMGGALRAGAVWTLYNAGFICIVAFGPAVLLDLGRTPTAAAAELSLIGWCIIPSLAIGGWLMSAVRRPRVVFYACLFASAALSVLASTPLAGFALFAALGLLIGPPGPLIMTLPARAAAPEKRGMAMGVYFTCYYLGMAVIPALAGLLWDLTGTAVVTLWFSAFLLLAAAWAHLVFERYVSAVAPTVIPDT